MMRSSVYGRASQPATRWGWLGRLGRLLPAVAAPLLPLTPYAAVGSVAGFLIGLLLGSPWWVGALLGGAAALGTGTMVLTKRGWRPSTWRQLLDAWDPAGAIARWLRAEERLYRAPPPVFGLPDSWRVARYITGTKTASLGTTRVVTRGVVHAMPGAAEDREGPFLEVVSLIPAEGPHLPREGPDPAEALLLCELAQRLWQEAHWPPPRDRSLGAVRDWVEARERARRAWHLPETTRIEIVVDGERVPFAFLAEGAVWGALGRIGSVVIRLRGRDWDVGSVELQRVENIEPYLEGTRRRFGLKAERGS